MSATATQPEGKAPKAPKAPRNKSAKSAKYRYEAETISGEHVKGLRVTKIAEKKGLNLELTKEKVPLVEIMHFSRQMATFLRAGVPMTEALDNLRIDATNKRFKAVLGDVLDRVTGGRSVTEALS